MSIALLFPGQGTQHPEMLSWLEAEPAAADTLAQLAAAVGVDWRERLQDADWASGNAVAQPLLTGLCVAAWQSLAPHLADATVFAGYSVGELAAFCAAGVFDAATAMRLARQRAEAMERSTVGIDTGLMAVQGTTSDLVERVRSRHVLEVAIRQSVDRFVLGGPLAALADASTEFTSHGARCTQLAVRVASHTSWMKNAAQDFARQIETLPFHAPRGSLVSNYTGSAVRGEPQLKRALAEQIASTLQWDACVEWIAERRVRCVLEIGPGGTLSRLWNELQPDIAARSIDEFRSADAIVRWVRQTSI